MIGWLGVLGGAFDFLFSELSPPDEAGDDAEAVSLARALLKTYFAIESVEQVSCYLLERLNRVTSGEKSMLYDAWFLRFPSDLESVEAELEAALEVLGPPLAAKEPTLATLAFGVNATRIWGSEFLRTETARSGVFEEARGSFSMAVGQSQMAIDWTQPCPKAAKIDFRALLPDFQAMMSGTRDCATVDVDALGQLELTTKRYSLQPGDVAGIRILSENLTQNLSAWIGGKSALRRYLVSSYRLEDVLWETSPCQGLPSRGSMG